MKENTLLTSKFKSIIENIHPRPSEISFAVIDLISSEPEIAGYNIDHFIYPASIYKVFIAAEVLRQIDSGQRKLSDEVEIDLHNEVDKNVRFFPKDTHKDYRPLLKAGDKATLDYLLDLMLTRSDNTAANVLMDIAERENINQNIILANNWQGSEVTRKFLDRLKEKGDNRISSITVSNAKHLAELFYKIETNQLVNPWVSGKLKEYMLKWNRDRRKGLYLTKFDSYYRKGGWLEVNGYKLDLFKAIRSAYKKGYAIVRYSGDAGVVKGRNSHYSIALLTQVKTKWPWQKFNMEKFSREIFKVMENAR